MALPTPHHGDVHTLPLSLPLLTYYRTRIAQTENEYSNLIDLIHSSSSSSHKLTSRSSEEGVRYREERKRYEQQLESEKRESERWKEEYRRVSKENEELRSRTRPTV